jgi:PhnB protein
MPQPIPYLSFNGNCTEAMRFYEAKFSAKLEALMSYGDIPDMPVPPEAKHLIMHAYLTWPDGGALMAGDCPPHMTYEPMKGIMLALTYKTVEEATSIFNALAQDGQITMPLAPTSWAQTFGMVTDKFGLNWGINGAEISAAASPT